MIFRFGGYSHADGAVKLSVQTDALRTAAGHVYAYSHNWTIDGVLLAPRNASDAQAIASIASQSAAVDAAYRQTDVGTVGLYRSDGAATNHVLRSADTLGGIRVESPPSYLHGEGAEGATYRSFTARISAITKVVGAEPEILSFRETIQTAGGGPEYAWTRPLWGRPRRTVVREKTIYTATQSGEAVGLRDYPELPEYLWPDFLAARPQISKSSPRRSGYGYFEFPISWAYDFVSADPFFGDPHRQEVI